jgi:hypothetical protein
VCLLNARFQVKLDFRTAASPAGNGQILCRFRARDPDFVARIAAGAGCFADPATPKVVWCSPPFERVVIRLGPPDDKLKLRAELPGRVDTGKGDDRIDARNGERDVIDGGPGDDVAEVDPKDDLKDVEVVKPK